MSHQNMESDYKKIISTLEDKIRNQQGHIFKLKELLDNVPGDIYWKDTSGVWLGLNKHCLESLVRMGFIKTAAEEEVLGKSDYDIFDKITAEGYSAHDKEVLEKQQELIIEENTYLASGEKLILHSIKKPLFDNLGCICGVIGNTIDITYLKSIESELEAAKDVAEATNYIMTELIANIGHDLATPITDVGSVAQLLNFYSDEYPELKEFFEILLTRSEACEKVRKSIIEATSISNLEIRPEKFSIAQELLMLEKELRPTIGSKNLKLIIHPFKPKKEDVIETDQEKFHDILSDLMSNAIKFTEKGEVTVSVSKKNDLFYIKVSDTGIGIPSDKFDFIFEQYTKLSRSNKHGADFKGVGAGLYLAKIRANILKAKIRVESEINKGSTFTLSIPCQYPKKNENAEQK